MIQRCCNPRCPSFENYGARGIGVCDTWQDFSSFLADMGERPDGTSIDRIDNSRGYEPGNCRWATRTEQNRNTRAVKLSLERAAEIRRLVADGMYMSRVAVAFGVSETLVRKVVHGESWK